MSTVNTTLLNWLNHEKHVYVKEQWLQACIQWVEAEYGEDDVENLKDRVYEQWLLADLDVTFDERGCTSAMQALHKHLKSSITEQQKTLQIESTIVTQIEHFNDISKSIYSQVEDVDALAADGEGGTLLSEKGQRMLSLTLTDGMMSFRAAEIDRIEHLDTSSLKIGCKLLLTGPIKCHMGVLFLKKPNVAVLGGGFVDGVKRHLDNLIAQLSANCVPEDRAHVDWLRGRLDKAIATKILLSAVQPNAQLPVVRQPDPSGGIVQAGRKRLIEEVQFNSDDEILLVESYQQVRAPSGVIDLEDDDLIKASELLENEPFCLNEPTDRSSVGLSYFWKIHTEDRGKIWRVRGFILSITKRLYVLNNRWALHCLLNDGVSVEECLMLDGVLDGIIGITAEECRGLPADRRQQIDSPESRKRWQTALANLCDIMEVTFTDPSLGVTPKFTVLRIVY